MSVTFCLPYEFYSACVGEDEDHGDFNVSNVNAGFIVREVLGIDDPEAVYDGSLATHLVAQRVATYLTKPSDVVAPSETQGVYIDENGVGPGARFIDCGRSEDQVLRYLRSLRHLVDVANERGAPEIVWG
jgi:hypothetical protein